MRFLVSCINNVFLCRFPSLLLSLPSLFCFLSSQHLSVVFTLLQFSILPQWSGSDGPYITDKGKRKLEQKCGNLIKTKQAKRTKKTLKMLLKILLWDLNSRSRLVIFTSKFVSAYLFKYCIILDISKGKGSFHFQVTAQTTMLFLERTSM